MNPKRLIAIVTVKNGFCVQSFGYRKYRIVGNPLLTIKNLDDWNVDEIILNIIDRSKNNLGPDFDLLKKVGKLKITTPLVYAGGIRNANDALSVIKYGADRICLGTKSVLYNLNELIEIEGLVGRQSMICSLPLCSIDNIIHHYDYHLKVFKPFSKTFINKIASKIFSELLIIDYLNEGKLNAFSQNLPKSEYFDSMNIIAFGGISNPIQIMEILKIPNINAIAMGNTLYYSEILTHQISKLLKASGFRQITFSAKSTFY